MFAWWELGFSTLETIYLPTPAMKCVERSAGDCSKLRLRIPLAYHVSVRTRTYAQPWAGIRQYRSWARCMIGIGEVPRCIPAKLVELVSELVPSGKSLVDGNHDARSDAIMHPALCHELVTRCRSMHA